VVIETDIVIVGGGPVGLAASLLLSRQGVRSLLVERHPGTAILPKARGINARTMEIFRQHGIEDTVRATGLAPEKTGFIVWTESLAGKEIERRVPGRMAPQNRTASPVLNCLCAQDYLEPVLRQFAAAEQLGTLRFSAELTDVAQDADGVTATVIDRTTGASTDIRARYLIAADGAKSSLRRMLGVRMIGRERVYDSVNILFEADLRQWIADRPAALYFVEQPDLRATFLTINAADRWGFLIHSIKQYGYGADDFTPELCTTLIRQGVGVPDLPVKILGACFWEASAHVAEQYRHGRIFLAGDAAHEMPPTGGFGMNTGVQDVHNLAWKLAAVLHGHADERLLDSYHDERQPLGRWTTETSLENSLSMGRTARQANAKLPRSEFLNEQGLIFGASYESAAVVADGTELPAVDDVVTHYVPTARPGSRAPHIWLERDGTRLSTIDLVGRGFVLLTGTQGEAWLSAAQRIAATSGIALTAHAIGGSDLADHDAWCRAYDVAQDGAVLVRPDGYVAWRVRARRGEAEPLLRSALHRILGREVMRTALAS
jgi:2-polyprenyl-6-methoxyphenol hydroxylase-like FAD-dependent oxidoreductase